MKMVWEKWIAARLGIRTIIVLLYTYISLTASMNHTCNLATDYHRECTNHEYNFSSQAETITASDEISLADILNTKSHNCLACLYSLLAKSSEISQRVSPVAVEAPSKIQILSQLKLIKPSEYLSSVSLRAPPGIIS